MKDQPARRRIAADLQTNFLVEASAGSGKTSSLVARLASGLLQGVYQVERVAVVTFTRKAAAELSARLRSELEKQGASQLLHRLPEMFVGTVHSFCGQILREYPVEAGISPTFRELEERHDLKLQARVLRRSLEEPEGQALRRWLGEFGAEPADLLPALARICDHGDLSYPVPSAPLPDLTHHWQRVEEFAGFLTPRLPACSEEQPTCKIVSAGGRVVDLCQQVERGSPGHLLKLLCQWEAVPKPVKRYWGTTRAEQNAALQPVVKEVERFRKEVVAPALAAWRSYLYCLCLPFLTSVRQACQHERSQMGWVSYHDLLLKCRQLLADRPLVAERLQQRFGHLLVDEFQDTDPLQAEIFWRLAADSTAPGDWRALRPRPASLFLVGDPKQSIYRFRQADIEVYQWVRDRLQRAGGAMLSLTSSFRSSTKLCDWINESFRQLLPAEANGRQAAFSALEAAHLGELPAPVCTLTQTCDSHQQVVRSEAEQIADYILCSPEPPDSFLILTQRKADLVSYQAALQAREIPFQSSGEPAPLRELGRAFLSLLRVLSDPGDRAALVGVLRGIFFGHSDRALFLHVQGGGQLLLTEQPHSSEVALSLGQLHRLAERARTLPPAAAASQVIEELGLDTLADSQELNDLVEELSERGETGATLAQAVSELLETDSVLPRSLHSGQRRVVRVMNLHKAKGLEARIVFLAAPTQGLPFQVDHVSTSSGEGLLCLRKQRRLLAHPAHWAELSTLELEFLQAERRRLLYVACTRAGELLIVGRWTGTHASLQKPWDELEPFLVGCPELQINGSLGIPQDPPQEQTMRVDREPCRQPSWQRQSVSLHTKKHSLRRQLTEEARRQPGGREWGDLIHKLLEQLARRPGSTRIELAKLARWFSLEQPELAPVLESALDLIEQVRATSFWAQVLAARERLVEVPFGRAVGNKRIFGIIDLVLQQPDGWAIIDYKTDRRTREELLLAYAAQLEEYAASWAAITGEATLSAEICSLRDPA